VGVGVDQLLVNTDNSGEVQTVISMSDFALAQSKLAAEADTPTIATQARTPARMTRDALM
jgi:hypothetical protein